MPRGQAGREIDGDGLSHKRVSSSGAGTTTKWPIQSLEQSLCQQKIDYITDTYGYLADAGLLLDQHFLLIGC